MIMKKAIKEFNEIFEQTDLSATDRIELALKYSPYKKHGADEIRNRQETIRLRLEKIKNLNNFEKIKWYLPNKSQTLRNEIRAKKSGDMDLAKEFAENYHDRVKRLYVSDAGYIKYGDGGEKIVDWDYYSKSYRHPKVYKCAGVKVMYEKHPKHRGKGFIYLQNHLGNLVEKLPFPTFKNLTFRGLLDGDYFGRRVWKNDREIITRYKWSKRKKDWLKTGVSVRIPADISVTGKEYYEHGKTLREIQKAIDEKWQAKIARDNEAINNAKIKRFASRIARLCPNLVVTIEDCKKLGYCDAGIVSFIQRYNLVDGNVEEMVKDRNAKTTALKLRETRDDRVNTLIQAASIRVASLTIQQKSV